MNIIIHSQCYHENTTNFHELYIPQNNTYQGILATNRVESFALFTYKCGELDWGRGTNIGFGASDELYANLCLSGTDQATAVACLNSPTTEWSNLLCQISVTGLKKNNNTATIL